MRIHSLVRLDLDSVREMSELIAPRPAVYSSRSLESSWAGLTLFIRKLCIAMCAMYPLTLGIGPIWA